MIFLKKNIAICTLILFFCVISGFEFRTLHSLSLSGIDQDTTKARNWIKLSNKSLNSDKDLSLSYADSAYNLYKTLENKNGMGDALVRKGLALIAKGMFDESIEQFKPALNLFLDINNKSKVAKVLNNIGFSLMQKGQYDESITYYLKSLDYRQPLKDSAGIATCYTNIAIIFAIKKDLTQAEKYFNQAINIYKKLKDEDMTNKNLLNIGGIYKDRGLYQKSIEQIRQVYPFFTKHKILGEIARCHYILGGNYESLNYNDSAYNNYIKALKIYERIEDNKQIAGTRLKLAGIASKQKNHKLAIEQSNQALEMAKKMHTLQLVMETYLSLSESYSKVGDFEKAYENRLEFERVKDSIFSQESNQKILELEAKYQDKIKKKEIASLTTDKRLADLEVMKKRNTNFLLTGILLLVIVVSLLIYNQYRIKNANNAILLKKNTIIEQSLEEKEILFRELHHRVKNNLQFIWSLFNLQVRHVKDPVAIQALTEGKNRIKTMALIHQKLYNKDNISEIDMKDYIPGLASNILETYNIKPDQIDVKIDADEILLDLDTAIPLGLIMNEIITNSLKHYHIENNIKEISISLKQNQDKSVTLIIKDNGPGIPAHINPDTADSFGLKLIKSLIKQIKGDIVWKTDSGTETEINLLKPQK